ncbi:MAG TPA: M50 family metallopeptidase [Pyrinomonadaceae bacterium]|nr:M50 family metallopeptidase [Pyrinomonadaceae bacterium]
MKFRNTRISYDARPQANLLLIAAAISVVLWFIPFAEILTYPFRIFVTFIHEGGHAIAAVLTGNSVDSLSVAANASGETYTTQGGLFSQMFVSSAGYIGSMAYGALLLILIRRSIAARAVLIGSAGIVLALTIIYGVFKPVIAGGAWAGIPFTLMAGTLLSVGLIAVAKFASARLASFFVSFLAVQLVLNALLDLKTVFFLSSPFAPAVPTDAMNMANATGVPAIFWAVSWITLSLGILWLAMRGYVAGRKQKSLAGIPLDDPMGSFSVPELPSIQSTKSRVTDSNPIPR